MPFVVLTAFLLLLELQRGESPCTSTPSSDLRPSRCTCVHPEVALEMGLYREGIFMPTVVLGICLFTVDILTTA